MKNLFLLPVLILFSVAVFADGPVPVIRRQHAMSVFTFTGTDNLGSYLLSYDHYRYFKKDSTFEGYNKLWHIINTSPYTINTQERGRRWEETDRNFYLSLIDTVKGITTDSLLFVAKDYNINFNISGVKDGKLMFRADSSKAVYQYAIMDGEGNPSSFARNRILFIASSVIGLLCLLALYYKTKEQLFN